jgi:hypothetical protein
MVHLKDVCCLLHGLLVLLLEPNKVIRFGDFGHPPRQGFPSTRFLCLLSSLLFLFDDTLDGLHGFDIIVSSIVDFFRDIQKIEIIIYSPA